MSSKEIIEKQNALDTMYNNTSDNELKKELEYDYDILTCRLIMNDYLIYGYGLKTFLNNDYECAKNIDINVLEKLFDEQRDYLGNMDL